MIVTAHDEPDFWKRLCETLFLGFFDVSDDYHKVRLAAHLG